ncbi:histidinol-phosphatase [Polycladidibacter stylochi]|uniref:histidinol-phosphatase n=1 Tax=Polycladidibacter stylochi TaxID=1807766 RepID=UPI00082B0AC8|nr:histidinol-phosphatase [Pseudovibrio stylochi]
MSNILPDVQFLHLLADAADKKTLEHFRSLDTVENKLDQGFDPVTVADKSAEKAIRELIQGKYPDHGIIGEEYGTENEDSDYQWILDPVDGTRAFITGIPTWGTLIGLRHKQEASLGMLSQPYNGERFWGNGSSAHYKGPLGERRLKTRRCSRLEDAIMCTTSPKLFTLEETPLYEAVENKARLARYGTDCYAYAMLAAGLCDIVIESGLQTYDIFPLIAIIEGAGGTVTNWQGGSAHDGGQILATGDPQLHEYLLKMLGN